MTDKWYYIWLISQRGDAYGGNGGIASLLDWARKPNTQEITLEEAKFFWKFYKLLGLEPTCFSRLTLFPEKVPPAEYKQRWSRELQKQEETT